MNKCIFLQIVTFLIICLINLSKADELKKLILITKPEKAQIFINGELIGETPLSFQFTEYDTIVNVLIKKKSYVDENIPVKIMTNKTHRIYRELKKEGMIFINSEPINANVFLNGQLKGKTPLEVNQIPQGENFVELKLDGYQKLKTHIEIFSEKKQLLHKFRRKEGEISIFCNPNISNIYLNNSFIGNSPLINEDINFGKYTLSVEKEGYFSSENIVDINRDNKKFEIEINLKPKNVNYSLLYSALFPGIGQYYSGRKTSGLVYFSIGLGGVIYSSILYNNFIKSKRNYNDVKNNYENSVDPIELSILFSSMKDKHNVMEKEEKLFQNSLLYFSGLWLINLIDVYFLFPNTEIPDLRLNLNSNNVELCTSFNF